MPATSSRSHDRFATTRWSVVTQTANTDAAGALTELARRYWYPVYAYVRRCGHSPTIAEEITRTFLHQLVAKFESVESQRPQGYFRRYLLDELNRFLCGDWRESISESDIGPEPPPDLEARYHRDHERAASPEAAYQRSFALEVLSRALYRLRNEAKETGHSDMFDELLPFLTQDPGPSEYQAMATRLSMPSLALVVALKRLRQRLRELAGIELSDTVTTAEDLAEEQAMLLKILRETEAS